VDIFYGISLRKVIPNSRKPKSFYEEAPSFLNIYFWPSFQKDNKCDNSEKFLDLTL
jgi:hypothetical protein